jgi:hypothetical protein
MSENENENENHKHYDSSPNIARDLQEVKKTRMYVEKEDGSNISGIIIPHHTQIGLSDPNFESDLGVKGNINIKGNTVIEGDLEVRGQTTGIESGGGGSTKVIYRARMNLTTTGKFFTWQGSLATGAAVTSGQISNSDTMVAAPFDGNMTAVQMILKTTAGGYSSLNKIVIDIYKNAKWDGAKPVGEGTSSSPHNLSTDLEAGGSGNQFSVKIDDVDGAGSNMYYISRPITLSVSTGDILQFVGQRVGGTNKEVMLSVVLTESSTPVP